MSGSYKDIVIFSALSPVATSTGEHQITGRWDHLSVILDFTLGSLTDIQVQLIAGSTKAGTVALTDYPAYDANQTLIDQTLTASFSGALPWCTQNNTTRLTPAPITFDTWTFKVTTNGTTTGSSLDLIVRPFSLGRPRD